MKLDLTITARRPKPDDRPYYASTRATEYEDYTASQVNAEGSQRAIVALLRGLADTLDPDQVGLNIGDPS